MTDPVIFEPVKAWAKEQGFGTLVVAFTLHNGEIRQAEKLTEQSHPRLSVEEARRIYGRVVE